ncbi:alpha/beta hydrolase-fold protein [Mucilaginibacter ginsenosidivorans]|uniref:Uncharacterized protein n=1 Tax=Mucilaginibacter ginsenosidivorans TaxID=398053 RepID=A0A5B8UXM5_9SPHI|nr:alpha/beta hydrolase-fold protein [Mucilaginibacter ginsenosidivorans]QEC63723.1 hypothetical protein FRZ54_14455 [Mucilaginibacter ginsenosidivorans]
MKNLLLKITLTCLLFGFAGVNAQELMMYQQPKDYEMPPKMIPTVRKYWVSLPKDYNETTDRYPIIFLFDGDEQFLRNLILFDADQLTKTGEIPPCIIVGIIQRNRALDFGPLYAVKSNPNSSKVNGDKFFDFLKEELLPELKKNYRTQDFKIGIGHSLGGLFLLNSFTKDPGFFNAIVAFSPALEMNRDSTLFSNLQKTLRSKLDRQTFFCWSSGTDGINEVTFRPASGVLGKLLADNPNPLLKYKYVDLPGKYHNNTPLYTMLDAFGFVFSDWDIAKWYRGLFYDKSVEPVAANNQRNALIKKLYGFDEDPTDDRIQNNVGGQLLLRKRYAEALPYLKKAVEMKPGSSGYSEDLGEAEENLKNYPAAISALKTALANLDKNADDYKERSEQYQTGIKRLEGLIKQ